LRKYEIYSILLKITAIIMVCVILPLSIIFFTIKSNQRKDAGETSFSELHDGFNYNNKTNVLKVSKSVASTIKQSENHDGEKRYVFKFEGTAIEHKFEVTDSISVDDSKCEITITTKKISVFDIDEDSNYYYIKQVDPRDRYEKIVIIDAGHGGGDSGAIVAGVHEKELDLAMALKVYEMFEQGDSGIKAYMTRYGDETIDKYDRPKIANGLADMFVSIHCNTYEDSSVYGASTHFALEEENELSRLNVTGYRLANIIQEKIVEELGTRDRGISADDDFVVVKQSKMPAVLIEMGYMTNAEERRKLTNEEYQTKAAKAVYEGIIEAFAYE